ncbi:hypothetical protein GYH30_032210 [Glycine max]|nr:hypothetical protein GYH30_032210 [Glycine max]
MGGRASLFCVANCNVDEGVPPGKVAVMQIYGDTRHCHVLHLIHSGIP